ALLARGHPENNIGGCSPRTGGGAEDRRKAPLISDIDTIAVVGGGFMGAGIAESAAVAGAAVVVREVDDGAVEGARKRLAASLQRAVGGGKLSEQERADVLE